MSDTCIVCLGDLGANASNHLAVAPESVPRPDVDVDTSLPEPSSKAQGVDGDEESDKIAHLLPCGHILHNNCLKPWVERANSCPICRAPFNVVELTDRPGGSVLSSYAVEDRVQVAEIDPSMLIEYIDDEDLADFQPCSFCGDADNEELLLLCDGCGTATHTYCVGLDDVPSGSWYCDVCEVQHAMLSIPESSSPFRRRRHRTRASQIRQQSRNQLNSLHWARVWQSVRNRLDIDLDFPFDDEASLQRRLPYVPREEAGRRDRRGGHGRTRDSERFLDVEAPRPSRPRAPREPSPEPESLEEVRAWNAFERAREIENNPRAARKRREPSPSPVPSEPERKLKRPRTRRPEELAALAGQNGESSRTASAQASARINAERSSEPSFLQSLLREVEDGRGNSNATYNQASNPPTDHTSRGSSPSISPGPSKQSSPNLPSLSPRRPISPLQLSSPAAYSSPPFSPNASSPASLRDDAPEHSDSDRAPRTISRARARLADSSPNRSGLSLSVKSEIQKLVGRALKPHYRARGVSKDEYTDINRNISRKLYERAGNAETLDTDTRSDIEKAAKEDVRTAVEALKQKRDSGDSDAAGSASS